MPYAKRTLFTLFLIVGARLVAAQSPQPDTTGMFIRFGLWKHSYVKNGVKRDAGPNFSNLALEFTDRPRSSALFRKGQLKARQAASFSLAGAALLITGMSMAQNQASKPEINTNRLEWGLAAIMAGALLELAVAVPLSNRGRNKMNEAVFLYNAGW